VNSAICYPSSPSTVLVENLNQIGQLTSLAYLLYANQAIAFVGNPLPASQVVHLPPNRPNRLNFPLPPSPRGAQSPSVVPASRRRKPLLLVRLLPVQGLIPDRRLSLGRLGYVSYVLHRPDIDAQWGKLREERRVLQQYVLPSSCTSGFN